jgi:MinD-like ATPase involved in chromosome partitioning or flagellar assembly
VSVERSGRQSADEQQPPGEGQLAEERPDDPEVEPADDGLDWLREHIEARAAGGVIGAGGPLPPLAGAPSPPPADEPPSHTGEPSPPAAGDPYASDDPYLPGGRYLADEPAPPPDGGSLPAADEPVRWDDAPGEVAAEQDAAPVVEAPAVRRLRESSAAMDDDFEELGEASGLPGRDPDPPAGPVPGGGGRTPGIRPAPMPPDIRPAESLHPPGLTLGPRLAPPEPPAAATTPPEPATPDERPPPAGGPQHPPTAADLAGDWARDKEEPPLPGWDDLTPERLLSRQPGGPSSGWQAFVFRLTKGRIRPRPGRAERARRELEGRIAAPITGCRRVAVFTLKGGVGKTTTTVGLGSTFATYRADRVVAVDGSPDAGTLHARVRGGEGRSPRDLIAGASSLARYADVRANITQTPTGLEVVAATMDPSISEGFNENDYRKIAAILERFYSLILTDCGPGALHSVIWPVLRQADQLVIVCAPSVDGARSASLTLDWLEQHNFEKLARSAVVVLNAVRPKAAVSLAQLEEHFNRRCRAVVQVPFDRHLEAGAEIALAELSPATREAWLRLGAAVADGFGAVARAEVEGRADRRA